MIISQKSHCVNNILLKHQFSILQYRRNIDIEVFGQEHRDIWFSSYRPALYVCMEVESKSSRFLLICWELHMMRSTDRAGPRLVAFQNIWLLTVTSREMLSWKYFSVNP